MKLEEFDLQGSGKRGQYRSVSGKKRPARRPCAVWAGILWGGDYCSHKAIDRLARILPGSVRVWAMMC